jgi:carbon storage regulator CsrA
MDNKEVMGMLRLSVSKEEYLMIGKDVKITFLGSNGSALKLMIDAPKEINIARGKAIEKHAGENLAGENLGNN